MKNFEVFFEKTERLYVSEEDRLFVIKGWAFDKDGCAPKVGVEFEGEKLHESVKIVYENRPDVDAFFPEKQIFGDVGFLITFPVKKEDENGKIVITLSTEDGSVTEVAKVLANLTTTPSYLYEVEEDIRIDHKTIMVRGWMVENPLVTAEKKRIGLETELPKDAIGYSLFVYDSEGNAVEVTRIGERRDDIVNEFSLSDTTFPYGFLISWDYKENEVYTLQLGEEGNNHAYRLDVAAIQAEKRERERHFANFKHMVKFRDAHLVEDDKRFIKAHGFKEYKELLQRRYQPSDPLYQAYFDAHKASEEELKRQTAECKEDSFEGPMISVVVPTYNTPKHYLIDMIESVRTQSYQNWQLCVADGSEGNAMIERMLKSYHKKDPRIVYTICEKNGGISGNTNAALDLAAGDYIALLDHDDMLSPDALYEVAKVIKSHEDADCVYSDEDKFADDVNDHYQPAFKPDFNIDLLRSCNYITHLFVVRRDIMEKAGRFNTECDGSQDLDVILRCTENARNVYHIPKILYYWRCHPGSVAMNPQSKTYAYEAAKRAITNHLTRTEVPFDSVVDIPDRPGFYRVNYPLEEKKITVIVIRQGEEICAQKTIESLKKNSSYTNFEVLTANLADAKPGEHPATILNRMVRHATGEYLLFLYDDMEIKNPDILRVMLSDCEREDMGAVGAKIYYKDDLMFHTGIVLGYGDFAGRLLSDLNASEIYRYAKYANAMKQHNVSAVSAACMMTKKEDFNCLGGFDETLNGAYYDVDYCLRLSKEGKKVLYEPQAEIYLCKEKYPLHALVKTTYDGYEDDIAYLNEKWRKELESGDTYYNPNFSKKLLRYDIAEE